MSDLEKIFEGFGRRIAEIRHYHNLFRDFDPGNDHGAIMYAIVMRSQVQEFLKLVKEWEEYFQS